MLRTIYYTIEDLIGFFFAPLVVAHSLWECYDEWMNENWPWFVRACFVWMAWNVNDEAIILELTELIFGVRI